jgi:hypothetical protein
MKSTHYQITVRGRLGDSAAHAFEGLTATPSAAGTVICGELPDQAALFGVLDRIESLGLELLAVCRTEAG